MNKYDNVLEELKTYNTYKLLGLTEYYKDEYGWYFDKEIRNDIKYHIKIENDVFNNLNSSNYGWLNGFLEIMATEEDYSNFKAYYKKLKK